MSLPPGAREARALTGGDVNESFRVLLSDGRDAFVKTRAGSLPGEYAAEAAGLRWLGEPGALRTPRVLEVGDDYLALEWVQPGSLDAAGAEELGRGLALTHAAGAPRFGRFCESERSDAGLVGSVGVSNAPTPSWAEFYVQRRLWPLARAACERGALPASALGELERLCERIDELAGPPEPPARLHGDLWSGNVLADHEGRPWLIDPAPYGGHREVDLAMLRLFGAPSERVLDAYREATPLAEGSEQRVELYQLLPLLVHAIMFGGSYGPAAERVLASYVG